MPDAETEREPVVECVGENARGVGGAAGIATPDARDARGNPDPVGGLEQHRTVGERLPRPEPFPVPQRVGPELVDLCSHRSCRRCRRGRRTRGSTPSLPSFIGPRVLVGLAMNFRGAISAPPSLACNKPIAPAPTIALFSGWHATNDRGAEAPQTSGLPFSLLGDLLAFTLATQIAIYDATATGRSRRADALDWRAGMPVHLCDSWGCGGLAAWWMPRSPEEFSRLLLLSGDTAVGHGDHVG
jgi:hypothetical protein